MEFDYARHNILLLQFFLYIKGSKRILSYQNIYLKYLEKNSYMFIVFWKYFALYTFQYTILRQDIFLHLAWPGSNGCQGSDIWLSYVWARISFRQTTRTEFLREILYENIWIIAIQHSKMDFVGTFGDFSHTVECNSIKCVWKIFLYILA